MPTQTQRVEDILADALEKRLGRRPLREQVFHKVRGWKLDLSYPEQGVAIEIDGQRHLSHPQKRRDCEKLNAAVEMGYVVLVYPASSITTAKRLPSIVEQVARVVCGVDDPNASACVLTGD